MTTTMMPECDMQLICARCYDESEKLFPANCQENPESLAGQPLGMYHCPDCGAMVCAGVPHGDLCQRCIDRQHPGFDKPAPLDARDEAHQRWLDEQPTNPGPGY